MDRIQNTPRVFALVPAFNEGSRIYTTVSSIRAIRHVDMVLVIDDGSTDNTANEARRAGAMVLSLPKNVGKGGALTQGANYLAAGNDQQAPVRDSDIVLLLDADLGDTAIQAEVLLAPILDGKADMSIAEFPRQKTKAGFGLVKGLARKGIASLGDGFVANAPLSGQRALTWQCLFVALPFASGYGVELALTVLALKAGMVIIEVPTTMAHAATGRDLKGFIHRGKQFKDVLWTLILLRLMGR